MYCLCIPSAAVVCVWCWVAHSATVVELPARLVLYVLSVYLCVPACVCPWWWCSELKRVVVVAATNRPDLLDAAFLRPGRIDRMLYIGPPDDASRRQILELQVQALVACLHWCCTGVLITTWLCSSVWGVGEGETCCRDRSMCYVSSASASIVCACVWWVHCIWLVSATTMV